ncbi:MAG: metallophosphatase family protein [Kiritimatiellae bacterium]|nr:metallophosphatase family protein [Kiritimatiellia bacterium]
MDISRRFFIGGAAATVADGVFGAVKGDFGGAPIARIGVLSDVHLNRPGDEKHLLHAFEWFRDHGADGVLVAGDIADSGKVPQLARFAECWFRVFPDDRAPDGRRVERLFVYGNHDIHGWQWGGMKQYKDDDQKRREAIGFENNRKPVWERLFHEEFQPVWKKTVKGITVIGAHWESNHSPQIVPFMEKHGRELDPNLPFLYTQHSHPKDTCYGPCAWGHDNGEATRALSPFRNAVAFSGHSHYALTDERSVWQGEFTSIGTASLRYISLDYARVENASGNSYDPGNKTWGRQPSMNLLPTGDSQQGLMVDVFADRLTLHRRDFGSDATLGDDWTVPVPVPSSRPFAYAERAKKRTAPVFAAGAEAKAELLDKPPACARKAVKGACWRVAFPAAKTVAKCRPFKYEVTALGADGKVLDVRTIMAPGFHLPFERSERPGECVFPASVFPPDAKPVFEVRAVECFGLKGPPLVARVG